MKNLKLKKLVAVALVAMTISTVSPIGASAAWKQDSTGWWNTEGSLWSTGWKNIDGTWYNFGSDGYMKTGWEKEEGTWYYLNTVSDGTKGAMKTGWINDNGVWYFAASSGAMQTGVVQVDGKVYYLAASGAMATGTVIIDGVTYTFAASGEAIGDKIPTPTVAFASSGTTVAIKTPDTTTETTRSSSGGGGSHSSSNDITSLVSSAYSAKLASVLQNHPTLAKNISVTTGSSIVVKLLNQDLDSIEKVFTTAQKEDLSVIKARLSKAEEIMDLHSGILSVNGVSFKEYLAKAEDNYVASGGKSTYFKTDRSFDTDAIAERIKNNTLTYAEFKTNLKNRIIAMCDETKKAPEVKISAGTMSQTVTKVQKDGVTVYDTSLSIDTNVKGLLSLGDTTTGTYTVYCGTNYITVKVTK